MSDSEGKVLWQEIERLPPWEVQRLFPLSRSIWSCCRLPACLVLFSKAPLLSQGQGTLSWKTWLLPWTCCFIQFPKVFSSPLVPPFIAGSSGRLQRLFFPLCLRKHTASFCLWPWSLAPYFSWPEVRGRRAGPFWRPVHRNYSSWEEEAIHPLNDNKLPFAVTSGWKGRLFQTHR